jgi:hypothetical protein
MKKDWVVFAGFVGCVTIESDTNVLVSEQKRTESENLDARGSMTVPPRGLAGQMHDDTTQQEYCDAPSWV